MIFEKNGSIVRKTIEGKIVEIDKKILQEMGVTKALEHPDVHIPMTEFIKKYGNK